MVQQQATSSPPCLNANLKILRRQCNADGWEQEPNCSSLQYEFSRCPDDLIFLEEYDLCYTITNQTQFPASCPYEDSLSFIDYVNKIKVERPIWVPVHRNITNGSTGRLEWVERSDLYGEEIDIKYRIAEGLNIKNCLIYNISTYKAVNCDEYYSSVCAYKLLQNQDNNFCQQKLNNSNCFPADFTTTTSCFCVTTLEYKATRSEVCQNYAEFLHPYQNVFPSADVCWIGLQRYESNFSWITSKQLITYSAWAIDTDFNNTYGAANNTSKWTLTPLDSSLSCGICEQTVTADNSALILRYDKEAKMLVLEVYHSESLKIMDSSNNHHVKCFTDTFTSRFKAKYPDLFMVDFNENYTIYRYNASTYGPGFYWCEAFHYPSLELIQSNAVFVHDRSVHGNEYVLWLSFIYDEGSDPTVTNAAALVTSAFSKTKNSTWLLQNIREMKVIGVNETTRTSQVILHITAKASNDLEREEEFIEMQGVLDLVTEDIVGMKSIDKFLSSHFCYKSETLSASTILHWDSTNVGYSSTSNEVCILNNGVLARRNCDGNFIEGAFWEDFNETCANNLQRSVVTDDLNDLLDSNASVEDIIANLTNISEYYDQFEVIDIFLISRILRQISHEDVDLNKTATIISNIINSNRSVLMTSQNNLNSTNEILYYFDRIMVSSQALSEDEHVNVVQNNIVILIADIQHNISGVVLRENPSADIVAEVIYKNTSWESILEKEDLLSAILLPKELVQQLERSALKDPKLIISVFMKDSLFNEESDSEVSDVSKVFGVVIPGFKDQFVAPIQMVFKTSDTKRNNTCGFWKYRTASINSDGNSWVIDGSSSLLTNRSDYVLCEFWHVTHFAMLILDDHSFVNFDVDLIRFLDLTTDINCGLSLFGIAGILFTALLFKNWRRNAGNQVLINFVFAISLQIVLLYLSAKVKEATSSTVFCICVGALLHYSVVSEFCWMLVIAILQFKRFVQVFGGPPKWVLVKACITGWVLPLLPVVALIVVDPENYARSGSGICYPSYMGFYLALLLPVSLILAANIIIYIIILSDVFYKKAETSHCVNTELILQWRLVILLFFMLGITWTFALLAYAYEATLFLVLFCFTATLQGFVLFMFFIVFNKSTRMLYVKLFKRCCRRF